MLETYGIIYKAVNKINKKIYIGQTIRSLKERKRDHIKCEDNTYFHNALRKYGTDNFEWFEIDSADNINDLNYLEKYWIEFYNSYKNGYNMTTGGDGFEMSLEARKKISDGKKKYTFTEEHKANIAKCSLGNTAHLGHSHSEETKEILREKNKGNKPWNTGLKLTEEHKNNVSKGLMGNTNGRGLKGLKRSEESKRKTSETLKETYRLKRLLQYRPYSLFDDN